MEIYKDCAIVCLIILCAECNWHLITMDKYYKLRDKYNDLLEEIMNRKDCR